MQLLFTRFINDFLDLININLLFIKNHYLNPGCLFYCPSYYILYSVTQTVALVKLKNKDCTAILINFYKLKEYIVIWPLNSINTI